MKTPRTFTAQVFKEGRQYVSFNPELEVASCGATPLEARVRLREAIAGFLAVAAEQGTLDTVLEQAGYVKVKNAWRDLQLVSLGRLSVPV